jgi:hypothetical protein
VILSSAGVACSTHMGNGPMYLASQSHSGFCQRVVTALAAEPQLPLGCTAGDS